ncbi:MAG: hypothetical protein P8Z37_03450, partial [Acidobacteriota bacterium]
MSLNEASGKRENDFDNLKTKLGEFITRNAITQFESEDIVELIEEGEDPGWIVEQLQSNSPDLDVEEANTLLEGIKALKGPEEVLLPEEAEPETDEIPEQPVLGPGMPDLSQIDPSNLDLSQIADALPPGMKLPPGLDMNQIQSLMESPQGKIMSDFLLFCSEKGIEL